MIGSVRGTVCLDRVVPVRVPCGTTFNTYEMSAPLAVAASRKAIFGRRAKSCEDRALTVFAVRNVA